jgi:hypothetical protein
MLSKIVYYAMSIILVTTLIFVPLIFSYQHIIEDHILSFDISLKSFQYLVSSLFIFILLIYMKSIK